MTPLKKLIPLLLLFTTVAQASPITLDEIDALNQAGLTLRNGQAVLTFPTTKITDGVPSNASSSSLTNKTFDSSSNVPLSKKVAWSVASYTGVKGVDTSLFSLPTKAVVTDIRYDVVTKPTYSGASPSIQLNLQNGNAGADLLVATQVVQMPSIGLSRIGPVSGATAASALKTTGATAVYLRITGNDITAGAIDFFIDYFISD